MKPLTDVRILVVGAVEFSKHCLVDVLHSGGNVVAIFTLPPELAVSHADYADLSDVARGHGIPLHYVRKLGSPEHIEQIEEYRPDAIFVWGWSRIVGKDILNIPRLGCIGVHPSLLPANRGRHPLVWAIFLGLPETGLTFFWMDEGVDSGPILAQRRIPLSHEETARSLYDKIKRVASDLIPEFLPKLADGTADRIPQAHSLANVWRKRGRLDGRIDFRMAAGTIDRLVRALTHPYVGAHIERDGLEVKVWETRVAPLPEACRNLEYGRVIGINGREVVVRADQGIVVLVEHEFESLPRAGDYL